MNTKEEELWRQGWQKTRYPGSQSFLNRVEPVVLVTLVMIDEWLLAESAAFIACRPIKWLHEAHAAQRKHLNELLDGRLSLTKGEA